MGPVMTRIIAGELGGRRLSVGGDNTRPTSDRVREALFSMLDARMDLEDAAVLDLYAGSGALGLEAISRGARHAVFVEADRKALSAIRANIATCDAGDRTTLVGRSVVDFLAGPRQRFELILADPPYAIDDEELTAVLVDVVESLADDGLLVLERGKRSPATSWPQSVEVVVTKTYGDTRVEVAARRDGVSG